MNRRWLVVGAVVVLAALLVTTWGFGGFGEQPRVFDTVRPGTPIAAGLYEFVFTRATARHQLRTDYRPGAWEVTAIGTGRTTGSQTIRPNLVSDNSPFLARDDTTGEVKPPDSQLFGSAPAGSGAFTPGLPAIDYAVTFRFDDDFRPQPTLVFAVIDQRFGNNMLVQPQQDADEYWYNTRNGWRMELPLSELPPDKG